MHFEFLSIIQDQDRLLGVKVQYSLGTNLQCFTTFTQKSTKNFVWAQMDQKDLKIDKRRWCSKDRKIYFASSVFYVSFVQIRMNKKSFLFSS